MNHTIILTLLLTLGLPLGAMAREQTKANSKIPLGANLIFTDTATTDGKVSTNSKMVNIQYCTNAVANFKAKLIENLNNFDTEFNCAALYTNIKVLSQSNFVMFHGTNREKDMYLEVYCKARTLREKQIISLSRSCEQNPTSECYSESFLSRIDQVKPTQVYESIDSCR